MPADCASRMPKTYMIPCIGVLLACPPTIPRPMPMTAFLLFYAIVASFPEPCSNSDSEHVGLIL